VRYTGYSRYNHELKKKETKEKELVEEDYTDGDKSYDELKDKVDKLKTLKVFYAWWTYAKYCLILIILTTVAGCVLCVYSITCLLVIIYPDQYVAKNGKSSSVQSPIGRVESYFLVVFGVCCLLLLLFCSLGTANAQFVEFRIKKRNTV
jgi:hypothetical protein